MRHDNSKVYVPITTLQKHFTGSDAVQAYVFKVKDPETLTDGEIFGQFLIESVSLSLVGGL